MSAADTYRMSGYWYAVGYNDGRQHNRRSPVTYAPSIAFADYAYQRAVDYFAGESSYLPSIGGLFRTWQRGDDLVEAGLEGSAQ